MRGLRSDLVAIFSICGFNSEQSLSRLPMYTDQTARTCPFSCVIFCYNFTGLNHLCIDIRLFMDVVPLLICEPTSLDLALAFFLFLSLPLPLPSPCSYQAHGKVVVLLSNLYQAIQTKHIEKKTFLIIVVNCCKPFLDILVQFCHKMQTIWGMLPVLVTYSKPFLISL